MAHHLLSPLDATVKLPVRQKEFKFDSLCVNADDRLTDGMAIKSEERRGFRPHTRLHPSNAGRTRGRTGGALEIGFMESLPFRNEALVEEKPSHVVRPRARQLRASEGNTDPVSIPCVKAKGSVARSLHATPTANPSTQSLWVEGSSVLNQGAGLVSAAVAHRSDSVSPESPPQGGVGGGVSGEDSRAVRRCETVHAVLHQSGTYATPTSIGDKVVSDALAVARCSVIANALAGTRRNVVRTFCSRRLCAAHDPVSGPRLLPNIARLESPKFAMTFFSSVPGGTASSLDDSYASPSHSVSDYLEEEEVHRIKQLYFDYFDCEPVSISSVGTSGSDMSMFAYGATASPRPSSSVSRGDRRSFSQRASNTM
ncbi:hypothetical protein Q4I32_000118 [Leishmania shawi]|uniref:Uncharacterized protein n=2 Tax=Leishmania guyanensis species complex TaxID=38579 RepID=A0AAW3CAD6_9TRYP